ncbi:hypothetical protein CYMTET_7246 [Cymbomonas tetramitiformis]|uniref:AAA+ ATPase domain-containing protein n=1 Tax=Cymbomonas tetramitiformis TaxID=36881 RepID=A0AAE0GVW1_9CHLO|nr:hypothetical protein CYMTET_7246 [Cymbomonas tetramitiformis]
MFHGQFSAVMGPPSCGKTTLLRILAGRAHYGVQVGALRVHCEGSAADITVGFASQETAILPRLTVLEIFQHSAAIRLPVDYSSGGRAKLVKRREERQGLVEEVISELGLSEVRQRIHANNKIGGISHSQKQVVSIGRELVTNPTLLFLDEVLTGMTAAACVDLMAVLSTRQYAHGSSLAPSVPLHGSPLTSFHPIHSHVASQRKSQLWDASFGLRRDSAPQVGDSDALAP